MLVGRAGTLTILKTKASFNLQPLQFLQAIRSKQCISTPLQLLKHCPSSCTPFPFYSIAGAWLFCQTMAVPVGEKPNWQIIQERNHWQEVLISLNYWNSVEITTIQTAPITWKHVVGNCPLKPRLRMCWFLRYKSHSEKQSK